MQMLLEKPAPSNFEEALAAFIKGADAIYIKHLTDGGMDPDAIRGGLYAERGKRYVKLVRGGSVFCFIDQNGDVLKAASWKAPAKHARGNIFDATGGLGFVGPYGPAYLR